MLKVFAAQINSTIGDFESNFLSVKEAIHSAFVSKGTDVVVFPELTLTGYPPNDLLLRKDFVEDQLSYLDMVRALTTECRDMYVLIGAVTRNEDMKGKPLRNAAICYRNGEEVFRYYKQLLPTYNIFDEARYFEPGDSNQSPSFYVVAKDGSEYNVGVLICEDCWNDEATTPAPIYTTNPVKNAFIGDTIDVMITLNASPSNVGKFVLRYDMYSTLSKKYKVPFVYVNSVGGQDALIFDGYSFYVDGDKFNKLPGYISSLASFEIGGHTPAESVYPCNKDVETFKHLVLGTRDYIRKNGFKSVVVGSSGGIDSAVVLMLAKEALGADNVFAVTMPSKYSSAGSVNDSVALCRNLGVTLYTRPIEKDTMLSIEEYEKAFGKKPKRLTIENIQARIRGRVLMEFSNDTGALVLSTGNKSEISCGYFSLYGDSNGGLAVIGDLYKTEVFSLARWYNKDFCGDEIIPSAIVNKAPSAELWENQKDSDSLPDYDVLDSFLKLFLEKEYLSKEELILCREKIKGMSIERIEKLIALSDGVEFKRYQLPPTLRVHPRSWGFGRNIPITKRVRASVGVLF